jgi:hypothetical protein
MSRVRLLIGLACAGAAAGLVFVLAIGSSTAGTKRTAQACRLSSQQPAQPLALNTEAVGGNNVKTVAMEKEIFECQQPGAVEIRDHETFVEIVEVKGHGQFSTASRSVEESICRKDFTTGAISCRIGTVQLASAVDPTPLKGCAPSPAGTPSEFVAMDSATSGPLMKTVKVDKEVFDCSQRFGGQGVVGDYYLFTEIVESASGSAGLTPVSKSFDGIVCFKSVVEAQILGCERFTP